MQWGVRWGDVTWTCRMFLEYLKGIDRWAASLPDVGWRSSLFPSLCHHQWTCPFSCCLGCLVS